MVVAEPFTTASPVLANYNFNNLIEGIGNVLFYPGNAYEGAASRVNIMSSSVFPSQGVESFYSANAADYTLIATDTYKLTEAQLHNTLQGYALIWFGWGMRANNNNQGQSSGYITVHVNINSTSLGSATTNIKTSTGAAYTFSAGTDSTLKIDIPRTELNVGDTLSLVFMVYGKKASGSSGGFIGYGHDPLDRDGTYIIPSSTDVSTKITATIPFKTE